VVRHHDDGHGCPRTPGGLQHPAGRPGQLPVAAVLAHHRCHHHRQAAEGRHRRKGARPRPHRYR
jgi:hypothetical protein